jgi:glycosyltransferase involved in cell wall biosynthesis
MRVLIVSGTWPPDIGGPASHGPEFGQFLAQRGHSVHAVASTPDRVPESFGFPVKAVPRNRARPVRIAHGLLAVAVAARGADVAYATGGMYTRSAIGAIAGPVPLVMKLVSDPAYERARRLGLFSGTIESFQDERREPRIRALKAARDLALRRATRIVTPGEYLKRLAIGWGLPPRRIEVIPNPAPPVDQSVSREELRRRFGMREITYVFAGRFVTQKNVPLAVRALRCAKGVSLVLIGEGDQAGAIGQAIAESGVTERITVHPALRRQEAMQWVRAADAAVLPSDWEGFPHAAVEALSVGTPVIATAVGAIPEIVLPGDNGLLVRAGDETGFGAAMASLSARPELLERLRRGAAATGDRYAPERSYAAAEEQLQRALSGGR